MLSQLLLDELFNLNYRVKDELIQFLSEELLRLEWSVLESENNDLAILILLSKNHISCELRIDRLRKQFEICARRGVTTFFPISGDWDAVLAYLAGLEVAE